MKKIYNNHKVSLLLALFAFLVFPACENLDEDVSGVLVADSFFQNESDFELGVTSIYSTMGTSASMNGGKSLTFHLNFAMNMGGDDIISHYGSNKLPFREVDIFNATSVNKNLDKIWKSYYESIFRCNTVIEAAEQSELPEEKLKPWVAQARFVRALCYFHILRFWGEAPLQKTTEPVTEIAPSSVDDIMNFVLEDAEFAAANLPDVSPGDKPSIANKMGGKMLLADIYMKKAGWPFNDETYYSKAAQLSKEIISSGRYSMNADFADMFKIENDNPQNPELIFALSTSFTGGGATYANRWSRSTFPPEEGGWTDVMAQIGFFNAFPEGYRKEQTFHTTFLNGKDWTESDLKHPFYAKFRSGNSLAQDGSGTNQLLTDRSILIYRYPYALLTYAEAQVMADGASNADAYEAINMVRRRAMNKDINTPDPTVDLVPGLDKIAFRDSVIAEKGWEFACENQRFHDLVRLGKVAEMNRLHRTPEDIPAIARDIDNLPKESYYYLPFQEAEMSRNPLLIQKDGYN